MSRKGGGELLKPWAWPETHSNFTVNWREHLEPGTLASQLMVVKPAHRQQQARNESLSCTSANHADGLPNSPAPLSQGQDSPWRPALSAEILSTHGSQPTGAVPKGHARKDN